MRRETGFTRTSSHASLLVDPHVGEDIDPVHATELTFPVVALNPRLGDPEQQSNGPPDRPRSLTIPVIFPLSQMGPAWRRISFTETNSTNMGLNTRITKGLSGFLVIR